MGGHLSAAATQKLAELQDLGNKVQHVHGQVERYAVAKVGQEQLAQVLRRSFGQLKLEFMGAGLDALSQLAGSMEIAAGRGTGHQTKVRTLREGIGSMRFQVEMEQRSVTASDAARQLAAASRTGEGGNETAEPDRP